MRNIRERVQIQKGFTLLELLIVTSIVGILAAIGLPAFLGEQAKGQDATAKSNARNVMSAIESCHAETSSYADCDTVAEFEDTDTKMGVELTDRTTMKKGAVSIAATVNTFEIASYSLSGNEFVIVRGADGEFTRLCTTGGTGGCKTGDVW